MPTPFQRFAKKIVTVNFLVGFCLSGFLQISPQLAYANSAPKLIAISDDWQMILFYDDNTRSCTLSNQAKKPEKTQINPNELQQIGQANAYFFITNWPKRQEYFALSARSHLLLHKTKPGWFLFPDNSRFSLQQDDIYVRPDAKNRAKILQLLRQHLNLQMVNYSQDNVETRTNFRLEGIDNALAILLQYCPLPE